MEPLILIKNIGNKTAIVEFNGDVATVTYFDKKDYRWYMKTMKPLNIMTCISDTEEQFINMFKANGYKVLVNPPKEPTRVCVQCGCSMRYATSDICKRCSDDIDIIRKIESDNFMNELIKEFNECMDKHKLINPNFIDCPICHNTNDRYMCETCLGTGKVADI